MWQSVGKGLAVAVSVPCIAFVLLFFIYGWSRQGIETILVTVPFLCIPAVALLIRFLRG